MAFENRPLTQNLGELFANSYKEYPVQIKHIGYGRTAIENTLAEMKRIINESKNNFKVQEFAAWIVKSCPPNNKACEAETIFNYVRDNVRYLYDPVGLEKLTSPLVQIDKTERGVEPVEDCDGFTTFLGSLYKAIGLPFALRATGYKADKKFSHVYGLVRLNGKWIAADAIRRESYLGWEAPDATIIRDMEV